MRHEGALSDHKGHQQRAGARSRKHHLSPSAPLERRNRDVYYGDLDGPQIGHPYTDERPRKSRTNEVLSVQVPPSHTISGDSLLFMES